MGYLDFILNLAGLLLWINWRLLPFDPFSRRTPATLVGTLRRAAPSRFRRWHLLASLLVLLFLRALIYRWIGPAFSQVWVGKLDLGTTILPFHSDWLARMLAFSFFSFGLMLGVFYLWLLLLSILNRSNAKAEPVHRLVRMQLGMIDGWPRWIKMLLPFTLATLLWWLANWLFVWLAIIPKPVSAAHRLEAAGVIGLGSYLAWKFVAVALLVLHLLNTYIYFGRHPFWNYVNVTSQNLLAPLKKIPLCIGKIDFAPLVGIVIIILAAEFAGRGLVLLYARLPF
jgi:uncharacterized protein YggT (Ycf19 family)